MDSDPGRTNSDVSAPAGSLSRCVGDVRRFAHETWGRTPRTWHADPSERSAFADVFSVEDADAIVGSAARRPIVRVVRDGRNVDPASYTATLRLGGRWVDAVDAHKLDRLFRQGDSVVFQSLHRTWPPVRRFVDGLADDISHPLQANAYLTPASSTALAPHRDLHDVIVIQLAGSKHWKVEGIGDVTLEAGDRMYLPTGTEHSATAGDRLSLHLTIGIIRTTYRAVLQRMLADVDALDRPLPLDYRSADHDHELHDQLASMIADATRHLEHADLEAVSRSEQRRRIDRPVPSGFAAIATLDRMDGDTTIRWDPTHTVVEPRDDCDDDRLAVIGGRQTLRLPSSARPALSMLAGGAPVRVDDLAELDRASRLVVARRLVLEGICTVDG